ncbi:MAG: Tol biopolymer transport system component, partial [Kiritimatiellia bacterium]
YVAFSSTRANGSHIWLATLDGKHQFQVTNGRGGWTQPTWAP